MSGYSQTLLTSSRLYDLPIQCHFLLFRSTRTWLRLTSNSSKHFNTQPKLTSRYIWAKMQILLAGKVELKKKLVVTSWGRFVSRLTLCDVEDWSRKQVRRALGNFSPSNVAWNFGNKIFASSKESKLDHQFLYSLEKKERERGKIKNRTQDKATTENNLTAV